MSLVQVFSLTARIKVHLPSFFGLRIAVVKEIMSFILAVPVGSTNKVWGGVGWGKWCIGPRGTAIHGLFRYVPLFRVWLQWQF